MGCISHKHLLTLAQLGIWIADSPEEAVVPPDAAVVDEADVVSMEKVAVIIVIFTLATID